MSSYQCFESFDKLNYSRETIYVFQSQPTQISSKQSQNLDMSSSQRFEPFDILFTQLMFVPDQILNFELRSSSVANFNRYIFYMRFHCLASSVHSRLWTGGPSTTVSGFLRPTSSLALIP